MNDENVNKFVGACIVRGHISAVMMYASRGSLQVTLNKLIRFLGEIFNNKNMN